MLAPLGFLEAVVAPLLICNFINLSPLSFLYLGEFYRGFTLAVSKFKIFREIPS